MQTLGLNATRHNSPMNAASEPFQVQHSSLVWSNPFHQLGPDFYTALAPQPLPAPYWVGRSLAVADLLGLPREQLQSDALLQALAGNQPISGTQPLASVYSGHQFGHWAGQLGDGRACLLGEANGFEVQLKGSGLTPYSRMGDGRAVLRSSIREFLCSEAMHGLGIPTTRALCVIGSDEEVARESLETAAVVTRVAPSFVRFGHFEHFASRNQLPQLKKLADYVIERYYPDCQTAGTLNANPYANLLMQVTERTAIMVAHWQAVGFCHGVMNTDNMSILGLTIDYGPFQFLDAYDPAHICNHTDRGGRYAFGRQPEIAHWNLYALAQALMPLIEDQALAVQALDTFKPVFERTWLQLMSAKLGLADGTGEQEDQTLVADILALLAQDRVDYPIFWRRLSQAVATGHFEPVRDLFLDRAAIDAWLLRYSERRGTLDQAQSAALMLKTNPKYVLRNYLGALAIEAAAAKDFSGVDHLLLLVSRPFEEHPDFEAKAGFPPEWASSIEISCSS
ncbi:MAG TPA: YdiU family protein [Rhodoferax sp.]|nr:YdiU family protein [Rhodoferax sp.]